MRPLVEEERGSDADIARAPWMEWDDTAATGNRRTRVHSMASYLIKAPITGLKIAFMSEKYYARHTVNENR